MNYANRQEERDADYSRAYREWVASLPPDERAKLDSAGLAAPDATRHTSTREGDELRLKLTPAPVAKPGDEEVAGSENVAADVVAESAAALAADVLASFCARIRAHPNPMLAFDAACFASGLMDIEGLSEADLARRHHVTRSAFSKLVVQWVDTFDLRPSRGMRSQEARRAYRKARLTRISRHDDTAAA